MASQLTLQANVLTDIMLSIFRLNARLLGKGDQLVAPLNLTSARWQVIGAIALAGQPLTAPQIADAMGITRQGVQKQLNRAQGEGLIEMYANPRHERSPLYDLSKTGRKAYNEASILQAEWAKALVRGESLTDLNSTLNLLITLEANLESTPLPS